MKLGPLTSMKLKDALETILQQLVEIKADLAELKAESKKGKKDASIKAA